MTIKLNSSSFNNIKDFSLEITPITLFTGSSIKNVLDLLNLIKELINYEIPTTPLEAIADYTPKLQEKLIDFICKEVNCNNKTVVYYTYSPYIINRLIILGLAHEYYRKNKNNKMSLEKILDCDKDSFIDEKHFSIFSVSENDIVKQRKNVEETDFLNEYIRNTNYLVDDILTLE